MGTGLRSGSEESSDLVDKYKSKQMMMPNEQLAKEGNGSSGEGDGKFSSCPESSDLSEFRKQQFKEGNPKDMKAPEMAVNGLEDNAKEEPKMITIAVPAEISNLVESESDGASYVTLDDLLDGATQLDLESEEEAREFAAGLQAVEGLKPIFNRKILILLVVLLLSAYVLALILCELGLADLTPVLACYLTVLFHYLTTNEIKSTIGMFVFFSCFLAYVYASVLL